MPSSPISSAGPQDLAQDGLTLNKLRFPSSLYGRKSDISQLHAAYHRMRKRKSRHWCTDRCRLQGKTSQVSFSPPEVVLISGRSGTGKTALAQQLSSPVKRNGGFFVSGKFDIKRQETPYTAFTSALTELCNEILSLIKSKEDSSSSFALIRSNIRQAIGSEAIALAEVIPNLSQIVGESQTKTSDVSYKGTKNQFSVLLRRFFRAVCIQIPIVLFLDDLQWADVASLDLLNNLLTDRENSGFLMVACYRDDEIDTAQSLTKWLRAVERPNGDGSTVPITRIALGNLDVETVNEFISDVLSQSVLDTKGLASVVHKKTHGNVFFMILFLNSLQEKGNLRFCLGSLCWKWNDNEVQASMSVTDNVVEMMVAKIRNNLTMDVRFLLEIGACLGSSFDASTLTLVMKEMKNDSGIEEREILSIAESNASGSSSDGSLNQEAGNWVLSCLEMCANEGLLEKIGASTYRFSHHHIQFAVVSLIPEESSDLFQFRIGEVLMNNLSEAEFERVLFIAVDLLYHGVGLILGDDEKCANMALLNLRAGEKAMKSSAFDSAATYLKKGIGLLGPNPWKDQYELSLALFTAASEAESCNGNFEEMQEYLDHLLPEAVVPICDKVQAYSTLIYSMCFSQEKTLEATDIAMGVLNQLGVRFPKRVSKRTTNRNFRKTRLLLKGQHTDVLLKLPIMDDENKLKVMQILDNLLELGYFANPCLATLVVFEMVQNSVCNGICKYSCGAFAMYGLILCGMGDIKEGNAFGRVAISLLGRLNAKEIESKVHFIYNNFLSHWVSPAHLVQKEFLRIYDIGMQTGDIGFAMFSMRSYNIFGLFVGRPLSIIDEGMATCFQEIKECRQEKVLSHLAPLWQFTLNLMGCSDNPVTLSGRVMQQEDMLRQCTKTEDSSLRFIILACRLWLAYYFGEYEIGQKLITELKGLKETVQPSVFVWRNTFFQSLTAFALARNSKKRRKWKCHAVKVMYEMKKWVRDGNVNLKHALCLLEAEKAALDGNTEIARKKYEEAISISSRFGFIHDKALAHERAGKFFLGMGDSYWGKYHIEHAYQLYSSWGSRAKVNDLQNKHLQLLGEVNELSSEIE